MLGKMIFHNVQTGEKTITEVDFPEPTQAELNARRVAEIDARLMELDRSYPRGLEDVMSVLAVDETKLPGQSKAKLTEKRALRAERATLV